MYAFEQKKEEKRSERRERERESRNARAVTQLTPTLERKVTLGPQGVGGAKPK